MEFPLSYYLWSGGEGGEVVDPKWISEGGDISKLHCVILARKFGITDMFARGCARQPTFCAVVAVSTVMEGHAVSPHLDMFLHRGRAIMFHELRRIETALLLGSHVSCINDVDCILWSLLTSWWTVCVQRGESPWVTENGDGECLRMVYSCFFGMNTSEDADDGTPPAPLSLAMWKDTTRKERKRQPLSMSAMWYAFGYMPKRLDAGNVVKLVAKLLQVRLCAQYGLWYHGRVARHAHLIRTGNGDAYVGDGLKSGKACIPLAPCLWGCISLPSLGNEWWDVVESSAGVLERVRSMLHVMVDTAQYQAGVTCGPTPFRKGIAGPMVHESFIPAAIDSICRRRTLGMHRRNLFEVTSCALGVVVNTFTTIHSSWPLFGLQSNALMRASSVEATMCGFDAVYFGDVAAFPWLRKDDYALWKGEREAEPVCEGDGCIATISGYKPWDVELILCAPDVPGMAVASSDAWALGRRGRSTYTEVLDDAPVQIDMEWTHLATSLHAWRRSFRQLWARKQAASAEAQGVAACALYIPCVVIGNLERLGEESLWVMSGEYRSQVGTHAQRRSSSPRTDRSMSGRGRTRPPMVVPVPACMLGESLSIVRQKMLRIFIMSPSLHILPSTTIDLVTFWCNQPSDKEIGRRMRCALMSCLCACPAKLRDDFVTPLAESMHIQPRCTEHGTLFESTRSPTEIALLKAREAAWKPQDASFAGIPWMKAWGDVLTGNLPYCDFPTVQHLAASASLFSDGCLRRLAALSSVVTRRYEHRAVTSDDILPLCNQLMVSMASVCRPAAEPASTLQRWVYNVAKVFTEERGRRQLFSASRDEVHMLMCICLDGWKRVSPQDDKQASVGGPSPASPPVAAVHA